MRSRIQIMALVVCLAAAACGSDGEVESATTGPGTSQTPPEATSSTSASTSTSSAPTTTIDFDPDATIAEGDPVVDFVALLDEALVGTSFSSLVLEDPDVFVATGVLFCDALSAGTEPAELVAGYVEELEGTSIEFASENGLVLAGALLGAAVAVLCPEFADAVGKG